MKVLLIGCLGLLMVLFSQTEGAFPSRNPPVPKTAGWDTGFREPLRALGQQQDVLIGAAVEPHLLSQDACYARTIRREFNLVTPENVMKFEQLQPSRGHYSFGDADRLVRFAKANSMQVRGHTLMWHHQLPPWLVNQTWRSEELAEELRAHIQTVVSRYRTHIFAWDVVNEAIADDGSLRPTFWLEKLGPSYIANAFRWAHAADPYARLFYNDYGGEGLGEKAQGIYNLVRRLVQDGVPIHGVGLQMHVSLEKPPNLRDIAWNIHRLAALGLEVHITELDVMIGEGTTPPTVQDLHQQARLYRQIMNVCLNNPACTTVVTWGVTDRYSWRKDVGAAPLLFDQHCRPKPAYFALSRLLQFYVSFRHFPFPRVSSL